VPKTTRSRALASSPEQVWAQIAEPRRLARWWPRAVRVEATDSGGFTQVLQTRAGRTVRADFRVLDVRAPRHVRWEQQLEGSPFERVLRRAAIEVDVDPAPEGARVTLVLHQSLRGMARLGAIVVRRAARRQLDEALDGLARIRD
jgi:uncharacterized protein YndB with AHSA1/START domain